jgi:hypothetical protein
LPGSSGETPHGALKGGVHVAKKKAAKSAAKKPAKKAAKKK